MAIRFAAKADAKQGGWTIKCLCFWWCCSAWHANALRRAAVIIGVSIPMGFWWLLHF